MQTQRLFYTDQYQREFTSKVVEKTTRKIEKNTIKPALILESTLFYPTSGGQINDLGTITFTKDNKSVNVIDVLEEKHTIVHVLDNLDDNVKVGDEIKGVIDWNRRLDHLQQHHGQHILSSAFILTANIPTVAFHMSKEVSNIDLDVEKIDDDILQKVQQAANQVIIDARPVEITYHTLEEANNLPLRKKLDSTLEEPIRIVNIKGYDMQPCCGTHPNNTSEVQSIVILGTESIKKQTRLYFICGMRVVNYAYHSAKTFSSLGRKLGSAGTATEVEKALELQLQNLNQIKKTLNEYEKIVFHVIASELYANAKISRSGHKLIVSALKGKDMRIMRTITRDSVFMSKCIVCLFNPDVETQFVIAISDDLKGIDLREVLKSIFNKLQGKGGGQATSVTGTFKCNDAKFIKIECEDVLSNL